MFVTKEELAKFRFPSTGKELRKARLTTAIIVIIATFDSLRSGNSLARDPFSTQTRRGSGYPKPNANCAAYFFLEKFIPQPPGPLMNTEGGAIFWQECLASQGSPAFLYNFSRVCLRPTIAFVFISIYTIWEDVNFFLRTHLF